MDESAAHGLPTSPSKIPADGPPEIRRHCASIYPRTPLPGRFVEAVKKVEEALGSPVWLILQDGSHGEGLPFHHLDETVLRPFLEQAQKLPRTPIKVILDSPGGQAYHAYRLAHLFRTRCGGYEVYVPEFAKSAATLFALGAEKLVMSPLAQIGPLDVQVFDAEREGMCSALDEVQALERLNSFALQAVDAAVLLFRQRSGKSVGSLLPPAQHFVAEMLQPLFQKLDTVHYTQMSRLLKIGEEYAIRLLQPRYSRRIAEQIARHLVHNYPEHGFYIDGQEANSFALNVIEPSDVQQEAFAELVESMRDLIVIGQIEEMSQ